MIISASRRTDIPAHFAPWFYNRLREGFVCVRNPMRYHQVARISLARDVVDGFVFWTKNPAPMLPQLSALHAYPYYFQYTMTPYGPDIEANVPPRGKHGVPVCQQLSDHIGPNRIIWRYDPILLSPTYTTAYHIDAFERMAKRLAPHVARCTIGFIDATYKNAKRQSQAMQLQPVSAEGQHILASAFAQIGQAYGLMLDACCEDASLAQHGIGQARCVDNRILEAAGSGPLRTKKDPNQRAACQCAQSIDIGAYNCCPNGCRYCYANYKSNEIERSLMLHDASSPLLIGRPGEGDTVYDRVTVHARTNRKAKHPD